MPRGRAARAFALALAACLGRVAGLGPNSLLCSKMVMASIEHIVAVAYDINEAAVDCTLPGLEEMSCAADITDMMSYWFNLGARITTATLVCGALDNTCAANIIQSLGDISDASSVLIAAANDCETDPWLCTYDVVTEIDVINAFVEDIIFALQTCDNPHLSRKYLHYWAWLSPAANRRLSSAAAGAASPAAAPGRAERARQAGEATDVSKLYEELQAELDALPALAGKARQKRELAGAAWNRTAAEEKRAAFQHLQETVRQQRVARQERNNSSSSNSSSISSGGSSSSSSSGASTRVGEQTALRATPRHPAETPAPPGGQAPLLQQRSEAVFV